MLPVTGSAIRGAALLVEDVLFLILDGAEKRPRLAWRHRAVLPFLGLHGFGLLLIFFFTLLTSTDSTFFFFGGAWSRSGLPSLGAFCLILLLGGTGLLMIRLSFLTVFFILLLRLPFLALIG